MASLTQLPMLERTYFFAWPDRLRHFYIQLNTTFMRIFYKQMIKSLQICIIYNLRQNVFNLIFIALLPPSFVSLAMQTILENTGYRQCAELAKCTKIFGVWVVFVLSFGVCKNVNYRTSPMCFCLCSRSLYSCAIKNICIATFLPNVV